MQRIIAVAVLVAGLGAGYAYYRGQSGGSLEFRTEPVSRGELVVAVIATGTLEPEDVVDVGAQVAGMIKEFGVGPDGRPIDYDSQVEPGVVLARIDDSLYRARVAQSKAQLAAAEARVEQARAKVLSARAKVQQGQANVQRARADVEQLAARLVQADRDRGRANRLAMSQTVTQAELDAAETNFIASKAAVSVGEAAIAQSVAAQADAEAGVVDAEAAVNDAVAAVALARAVVDQDEINLGYCTIASPVKGTIIDRRVTIGQTVQSSFNTPSLFLIAKDLKRMKVWASVNEADISRIYVGQSVTFEVDAHPGEIFEGKVGLIRNNATNVQNVVTYTVEVLTDNSSGKLKPYLTANLRFEVSRKANVLLAPNTALRYRPTSDAIAPEFRTEQGDAEGKSPGRKGGRPPATVWIESSGHVRPIEVKAGGSDGIHTEILSGDLQEGTAVVTGESQAGAEEEPASTSPFVPQRSNQRRPPG